MKGVNQLFSLSFWLKKGSTTSTSTIGSERLSIPS
jgi:hypothetical protein